METKVNFAVVGAFVLVLGAGLIAGVLWLSSGGASRRAYDVYLIYMSESVSGLNLDAPVKYHGVEVGRVRKMTLAPMNPQLVQLNLDIERGTPVKEDTVAVLRVQGLTGIAYVELSGGNAGSPPLEARPGEDYPVIRSGPSLMVRLDSAISALLTNVNRTSESMSALMDEDNRRVFRQTLAELHVLSRTLAARSSAIDASLINAARTVENTARLTGNLPRLLERVQSSAEGFDHMTGELARAGGGTAATLAAARTDLREATDELVPEVRQLVSELREVTSSLRRLSEELERDPRSLLFGKPAPRPGPGE